MAHQNHARRPKDRIPSHHSPALSEVHNMVEAAVIFLLFFAVLAAAWFYMQRVKARTTTTTVDDRPTESAAGPTDPAP